MCPDHGDPLLNYGDWDRPDHWGHWTLFTQPEGTRVPYTGVGSVLRIHPDGSGLQVVATGALRGLGDTRTPMICHFTGYWIIGLPLGWLLSFKFGMGAQGLWIGLSTGLIVIGIILVEMWRREEKEKEAEV